MGSEPTGSNNQWPTSRILRLVVPSLVVLLVALVLRNREHQPPPPAEHHAPAGVAADGLAAPATECRLLLFGEDAATLAEALRPKLRDDVVLLVAPRSGQRHLMQTYGVERLPAAVIEQPDAKPVVCQGDKAGLDAILGTCRTLGLLERAE
jgi:hypothetical protein